MKQRHWLAFFLYFFTICYSHAAEVGVILDTGRFVDVPTQKPYLEVYIAIDAASLRWLPKHTGGFQASAKLQLRVKKGVFVAYQDSLTLFSPVLEDTFGYKKHFFLLHQDRLFIAPGDYKIEVEATDPTVKPKTVTQVIKELSLEALPKDGFAFSDVLLTERIDDAPDKPDLFTKRELRILPYVANNYYRNKDSVQFYIEYYNFDKIQSTDYYIIAYITQALDDGPDGVVKYDGRFAVRFRQRKPSKFERHFASIPIKALPSQTYLLHIALRHPDGTVIKKTSTKLFIDNTKLATMAFDTTAYDRYLGYDEASLTMYLKAMSYLATKTERDFMRSLNTFSDKKNFFMNFWKKREEDPKYEGVRWQEYHTRIKYANQKFRAAGREGWQTERGRVLLLYGPPNDLQEFQSDREALPYQIWTYNKLGTQTGVIFVFCDNDLATNRYPLIHSTKVGEFYNPNWRNNVRKDRIPDASLDPTNPTDIDMPDIGVPTIGAPR